MIFTVGWPMNTKIVDQFKIERRLSFTLIFFILGLMALGAGVRTMGAGLACPDWPLCFGKLIPDFHVGVYFEFIHRAYAGLVSLLFFFLVFRIFRNPNSTSQMRWLVSIAIFVLLFQIIMGRLTVLKLLQSGIVAMHLTLATLFLLCDMILWMKLDALKPIDKSVEARPESRASSSLEKSVGGSQSIFAPTWLAFLVGVLPVLVMLQIVLGGIVASTYAGLMCVDFPLCQGKWVPTLSGPLGFQIMHRFLAYGLCIYVFIIAGAMHQFRNALWMTAKVRNNIFTLVGLMLLQIAVGIANLVYLIPPHLTVLHQFIAMLILLFSVRLLGTVLALVRQSTGQLLAVERS